MTKCQNQLYVIHLNKIHCRCKLFYGDPWFLEGTAGDQFSPTEYRGGGGEDVEN